MTTQNSFPFSEQDLKTLPPEAIVDAMTLAEQVSILSGDAFWTVNPIDRLGIGTLRVTDGPNGARGSDFIYANKDGPPCHETLNYHSVI